MRFARACHRHDIEGEDLLLVFTVSRAISALLLLLAPRNVFILAGRRAYRHYYRMIEAGISTNISRRAREMR